MPTIRLSHNGSIQIPPEFLLKYRLIPGCELSLDEQNGALVVRPVPDEVPAADIPNTQPAKGLNEAISRKNLETGVQFIKGIGPKLALFASVFMAQ